MRETGDERQAEKKNLLDGLLVFAQAMDPVSDGRGFFLGEAMASQNAGFPGLGVDLRGSPY